MDIRPLSAHLQKIAEAEINEVPNRVLDDLKDIYIEEWLRKQPHLHVRQDRQWLIAFLRCSKFSLQRTKLKLDYFYTIKSITPEFFAAKDPMLPEIQEILKLGPFIPITKYAEKAGIPSILFVDWKYADPNKMNFTDFFKVGLMSLDVLLNKNDNCTVNGLYIMHDMKAFSLSYLTQLTPTLCKKVMLSITKAYPTRIKGVYFFNTPPMYEIFINMFVPFVSEKIKSRLRVFGVDSFDKLLEEVPLSAFPKDYGGEGQLHQEIAEGERDWFLEDVQYRSDETRGPGKPTTSADIFGVEASFRQLDVD